MNDGGWGVRLVPGLDLRAGQTLAGKYRVEELVGGGASGIVLAARNIHLRERVALKIFASYTDGQEDLLRRRVEKAHLAARLKGEHVARIVDIGVTLDAMPYVATEWLEGTTLEAELVDRERLPVQEAVRWVLEACEALAEAHANGLVHGDLKPQNILLAQPKKAKRVRARGDAALPPPEVDTRVLKILDFGTTSPLDAIGDQSASAFFGSPAFLAPEQILRSDAVDARADVWALGALLYTAISGTLPFEADTVSGVLVAVVRDAPALLTDAPYELARLVHHCLDKNPAGRPQTVAELALQLAPFAGECGPRLAERVSAALDAPHDESSGGESPPLDAASGSMPPVSMPSAPPTSDIAKPTADTTQPSRRVLTRRQSRSRATVLTLTGAAAIAIASWAMMHPWALSSSLAGARERGRVESSLAAPPPPAAAETQPATFEEPPGAPPSLLVVPDPAASFAPTPAMTATPLAVTATPLAAAPPLPAAAPPRFVLPAPTVYRLPPGLPRTRDGLGAPAPAQPPAARADRK